MDEGSYRVANSRIEAFMGTSRFAAAPHLIIGVDGVPLDAWLADNSGGTGERFLGLVPALTGLVNREEREAAWERIQPPGPRLEIAPVLVCPDDMDLWCDVVVVELEERQDQILWRRFGFDWTAKPHPARIGSQVDWLPTLPALGFAKNDYLAFLETFRCSEEYQELDRSPW